jgi:hypothetical protein
MLPNHSLRKATALTLALAATLPTAATAKPIGPDPAGASYAIPPTPVVRITTPASGFDWGDAGIGAAGGLALAMLGVGGGLLITRQRPQRSRRTTAQPS